MTGGQAIIQQLKAEDKAEREEVSTMSRVKFVHHMNIQTNGNVIELVHHPA